MTEDSVVWLEEVGKEDIAELPRHTGFAVITQAFIDFIVECRCFDAVFVFLKDSNAQINIGFGRVIEFLFYILGAIVVGVILEKESLRIIAILVLLILILCYIIYIILYYIGDMIKWKMK